MTMFRNVVFTAALAGLLAGIVMTAMQAFATVPLILQAEMFEQAGGAAAPAHSHTPAGDAASTSSQATTAPGTHAADAEEGWGPADGLERYAFTALANIVTAVGFGLLLVAVSELAGGIASWREGLFWGLAGFAVFTLAPGLGLAPELPAMPAADLHSRQIWWAGTVLATAAGLALIVFRRSPVLAGLGIALVVLPHLIGAPQPGSHASPVPENLHHQFVVAVTITNLVFWVVLGAAVGALRSRFLEGVPALRPRLA